MSEEVEVQIRQIGDEGKENGDSKSQQTPFSEALHRVLLASIGAVALTYDEAEKLINRMVERGELAQKDGDKVLREVMGMFQQRKQVDQQMNEIGSQVGKAFDQFFTTFNIPSKRDFDDLNEKVADIAARVEQMRRERSQSSM